MRILVKCVKSRWVKINVPYNLEWTLINRSGRRFEKITDISKKIGRMSDERLNLRMGQQILAQATSIKRALNHSETGSSRIHSLAHTINTNERQQP